MLYILLCVSLASIPSGAVGEVVSADGAAQQCGTRQVAWKESCFLFSNSSRTWASAWQFCQHDYRGHLVWILNSSMQQFAEDLIQNATIDVGLPLPNMTWIGLVAPPRLIPGYSGHSWVHNPPWQNIQSALPASYTNWLNSSYLDEYNATVRLIHPLHADYNRIDYDCAALDANEDFSWVSQPCRETIDLMTPKHPFICQYEQGGSLTIAPKQSDFQPEFRDPKPFTLTCFKEQGYPPPTTLWFKDGTRITTSDHVIVTSAVLVLLSADVEDSGNYTCDVSNIYQRLNYTFTVPSAGAPWLHALGPPVTVAEQGEDVTLNCSAAGYPRPTISWLFEGQAGNVGYKETWRIGEPEVTSVLRVTGVVADNGGAYTCHVRTALGHHSVREAQIVVVKSSGSIADEKEDAAWQALVSGWVRAIIGAPTPLPPEVTRALQLLQSSGGSTDLPLTVLVQLARYAASHPGLAPPDLLRAVCERIAAAQVGYDLTLPGASTEIQSLLQVFDDVIPSVDALPQSETFVDRVSGHDVVLGLERILQQTAATLPPNVTLTVAGPLSAVWMQGSRGPHFPGLEHAAGGVRLSVSAGLLSSDPDDNTTSVVGIFPNYAESGATSSGGWRSTDSPLVAVSLLVGGAAVSVPVQFTTATRTQTNSTNITHTIEHECGFMAERGIRSDGQSVRYDSGWSTRGCVLTSQGDYSVTCRCNHTTSYAVLMTATPITFADPEVATRHALALSSITYACCGVSITACLLTMGVFCGLRMYRSTRHVIHMNLCCTLLLLQLTFLGGASLTTHTVACAAVTVLLHVAALAVFCWMLVEGLHLYLKVVKVYGAENSPVLLYHVLGYLPPVVIAAVTAGIRYPHYLATDRTSCWLPHEGAVIWAFIGPACFIILINLAVVIIVLRVVVNALKIDQDKTEADYIKSAARGLLVLLPITGLCWGVGLFAVNEETIAFQYLFAILNSLQGAFVFLFHCVLNKEVQNAFGRWQQKRASSSFSSSREKETETNGTRELPRSRDGDSSPDHQRAVHTPKRDDVIVLDCDV